MSTDEKLVSELISILRHRAEDLLHYHSVSETELLEGEMQQTIHELKLHKIELELQTEELLKTQKKLRDSREEYIYLYDHAPVGYLKIGTDGLIIRANIVAGTLLGYAKSDLLFRPLASFVTDLSVDEYHLYERAVTSLQGTQSCELIFKKNGGLDFSAQLESISEWNAKGEVVSWNTTIHNVTLRKKAEAAINQMQKIEGLSIMADGLTHDFNNYLAAIMTNAVVATKKLPVDNIAQNNLQNILFASERSAEVIQQLLTFMGRNSTGSTVLDLNEVINRNIRLLMPSIHSHITVEVDLDDSLPLIRANQTQLSQMIINLVLNAVNALGLNSGLIRLETKTVQVNPTDKILRQYTGEVVRTETFVALSIKDNGEGIESKNLPKIFDPFYSTNKEGRGLGLSSVLGTMRGYKGAVFVESEVNVFTEISLWFPLISPDSRPLESEAK